MDFRLDAISARLDPETVEQDLGRIVLGLMEFLRQLMELQAIRRMENGSLTAEEEERLGLTLMRAEAAIHKQAAAFGLTPEDLALDLGPLGRTI
ncbi:MAG: gas vesicle protein K [Pseudomonadota bacterium]